MSKRVVSRIAEFCAVICASSTSFGQPITWERVAKVGEPVPTLDGMVFKQATRSHIDDDGNLLTQVCWGPPGPPIPPIWCGLMYGQPGSPTFFLQEDEQAPGLPEGVTFNGGSTFSLAPNGFIGTLSTLNAPLESDHAIYAGMPGNMQLVDAEGQPYPAETSQTTVFLDPPAVNSVGQIAYHSFLANAPPSATVPGALSLGVSGAVTLVGQDGAPATAVPGALHQFIAFNGFDLNDEGTVIYTSGLSGPDITPANGSALLMHKTRSDSVVARTGSQAPDLPPGVSFVGLGSYPRLANTGSLTFVADVNGPGVDESNHVGIWAGQPEDLHVVARTGDRFPGLKPSIDVYGFGSISLSHSDRLLFEGFLEGDGVTVLNDQALWTSESNGETDLLIREGTQAFGLPEGVNFLLFAPSTNVTAPRHAQNADGDILLAVGLIGPGVTDANNYGLWFRDGDTGAWSLILRTGDEIDGMTIAPVGGVAGTSIIFAGASNSIGNAFSRGMNDDGSFVVTLRFLPLSPIYTGVYRFSVPEPGSLLIVATVVFGLRRTRLSRRLH